jgi:hypothetical protein
MARQQLAVVESRKECNNLNCFAKSHLIPQDAPTPLLVQFPKPLYSNFLVTESNKNLYMNVEV